MNDGVCRLYHIVDASDAPPIKRKAIFDRVFGFDEFMHITETNNCINRIDKDAELNGGRKVQFRKDRGAWCRGGYSVIGKKKWKKREPRRKQKDVGDLSFNGLVRCFQGNKQNGLNWAFPIDNTGYTKPSYDLGEWRA